MQARRQGKLGDTGVTRYISKVLNISLRIELEEDDPKWKPSFQYNTWSNDEWRSWLKHIIEDEMAFSGNVVIGEVKEI